MRIGIFLEVYLLLILGVVILVVNLKEGLEVLGYEVYVIMFILFKDKFENDLSVICIFGWVILRKFLKGFRLVFFVKRYVRKMCKLKFDVVYIYIEFFMGKLGLVVVKKECILSVYILYISY